MAFALWRPGMRITAERLNASTPGLWQSWTPIFNTTSGVNQSTLGTDSTLNCSYTVAGNTCWLSFYLEFGSTAVFNPNATGADNWTFSLPVPAAQSSVPVGYASIYTGKVYGVSGLAALHSNTTIKVYIQSAAVNGTHDKTGLIDASAPFAWAAGDRLEITGHYQIQ